MTAAVEAGDLFVIYRARHGDVAALRGLNLAVAEGEMVAVLGPSGAGKSTLLGCCAGWVRPSSGGLRVAGVPVGGARRRQLQRLRRDALGSVRQHYHLSLPPQLTAAEIVALPLRVSGSWDRGAGRRVAELLDRAGLQDRAAARPAELSGGEQQRLAVCAALAKRPRLVLADEPTGELDAASSRRTVALLRDLAAAEGAASLVVTHDPLVAGAADRVVHLRDGRVSAEGAESRLLVVDDHGWLRLPGSLRAAAAIGSHVTARVTGNGIELLRHGAPAGRAPAGLAPEGGGAPRAVGAVAVELRGLHKAHRGEPVLRGLSHTFRPGRLHVVAGPSGSGKTTLLDLICGLERPDAGQVLVGGTPPPIDHPDELAAWRRRRLGHLSQHATLTGTLSALEEVAFALSLRGWPWQDAREGAGRWLARVGMARAAGRRTAALSGGEQRRVALARAMAAGPALLVADEPTAHLDRAGGREVLALLERAAREDAMTVIASSHDPDAVEAADEVLELGG